MRRDPARVADEASPVPLRAMAIVLAVWIVGLVVLAFVVVPALFASCLPASAAGPPGG